ncbi:hypothetical protein XdyCFBP7245_16155 [Xanthomonas dyei]|uniref:Uncharacterized protein n=1 Tax=Xanthomonas dyei TaxID=743699 RepID=A0A2S7BZQ0_9XANT|nr:hypothetical protein XdyCFBP7245_16155 [Xanthomonas dyei]
MQRGRSKARAPMARKRCLLAPRGEGLQAADSLTSAVAVRSAIVQRASAFDLSDEETHSTRVPKIRSPASPRPGRM